MTQPTRSDTQQAKKTRGEMIAICSAKGGIGKTVLAVNLAVALSKNNLQIGLMDASLQFGDIGLAMDLQPTFTIKDVVEDIAQMDSHALASYLIHYNNLVHVLAAPERPEYAELVQAEAIEQAAKLLLEQHHYVIVDTGTGLQSHTLQIIEQADQVFLLTNLEMATIKNTKMMLETLKLLELDNKVQVVVNRATMDSVIKATDVPGILNIDSPFYVPNQFQIVSQSLNIGIPFVMNHAKTDLAKAVFKMAEQLISRRELSLIKPKPTSFLQHLFHKPKPT